MGLVYKSQSFTWSAGSNTPVQLDGLVPRRGPSGGRVVIDKILAVCTMALTTDGATTLVGDDLCGFLKEIQINDAGGVRRKMKGAHVRLFAQHEMQNLAPADPADVAISQPGTSRVFYGFINFASPRGRRGRDTALPIDNILDGGFMSFTMAAGTDMKATGGTVTIASGSYVFQFFCHEEGRVEYKSRDEVNYIQQEGDLIAKVPVYANLLKSCFLFKDAAGGGTAVTTVTDATIQQLGLIGITQLVLQQLYLSEHAVRSTSDDIFWNSKALPLVWPKSRDSKMADYPSVAGTMPVQLTGTWTVGEILYHLITPHSDVVTAATSAANGVHSQSGHTISTKTAGNTKRKGRLNRFLPWTASK